MLNTKSALKFTEEHAEEEIEDLDVEYDDLDDNEAFVEPENVLNETIFDTSHKLREYSIDLWNGSPFIPNWEPADASEM